MRKYLLLVSVPLVIAASPAAAADHSGPRIEIRGGWDHVSLNETLSDGVTSVSNSAGKDGYAFGAEIGYDAQVTPLFTLGGYAGGDLSGTRKCGQIYGNDEACIKSPRNFTVGARAGAIVGPFGLLYVKGGYSNGRLQVAYRDLVDPTNDFDAHTDRGGWHVGAGSEVSILRNGYFKVEYVYTRYDSYKVTESGLTYKLGGDRNQVMAATGLRF